MRARRSPFLEPDRVVIGAKIRPRSRSCATPLRAARRAGARHRRAHRGDDQVRHQRLPGHQDLVHQRDRQDLRTARRRRQSGGSGVSATISASERSSSTPGSATAARASPRTFGRWNRRRSSTGITPLLHRRRAGAISASQVSGYHRAKSSATGRLDGTHGRQSWAWRSEPNTDDTRGSPALAIIRGAARPGCGSSCARSDSRSKPACASLGGPSGPHSSTTMYEADRRRRRKGAPRPNGTSSDAGLRALRRSDARRRSSTDETSSTPIRSAPRTCATRGSARCACRARHRPKAAICDNEITRGRTRI